MGDESKSVAVILQDRPEEGLRMSVGLTLADDKITVINLGAPIEANEGNDMNVETLDMMECGRLSVNQADEAFEQITMQEVPEKLLEFDLVLPY